MFLIDKLLTFINFHIYNFRNELINPKNQNNNIGYRNIMFSYIKDGYQYNVIYITPDLKMICHKQKL